LNLALQETWLFVGVPDGLAFLLFHRRRSARHAIALPRQDERPRCEVSETKRLPGDCLHSFASRQYPIGIIN